MSSSKRGNLSVFHGNSLYYGNDQALAVGKMDKTIHRINHYPADSNNIELYLHGHKIGLQHCKSMLKITKNVIIRVIK